MPPAGMNSSLQHMFTPRRKRGKTWDAETNSGYLWLWAGNFKRWKRRQFSTAQPGLLTYKGRQKRGKRGVGGSIDLQGAALETSSEDPRMIIIRRPGRGKIYLRTTDPEDRDPCVESIQRSAQTYGTILARASALLGVAPAEGQLIEQLKPSTSIKAAKLSEEVVVARQLHERVKDRMQELAPFQNAFQQRLSDVQGMLRGLAASLEVSGGEPYHGTEGHAVSNSFQADDKIQFGAEAEQANAGLKLTEAILETNNKALPVLCHADSFQSAHSELQKSPSWHESATFNKPGQVEPGPLGRCWQAYNEAVADAIRGEALRVVELQAENEALKTGMRNFKLRAQSNARKLRALANDRDHATLDRSGSSESEEVESELQTPHQLSLDPKYGSSTAFSDDVKGLSHAQSNDYQQALAALEAVQKHAFAVNQNLGRHSIQDAVLDDPPPEAEMDYLDDNGSDEDSKSEQGGPSSRRTISVQGENVWEVAAQRQRLPAPAPLQRGFSIWSVLKNAIGKDLTRITLPATINEPLSALQRIVEDLEYRHMLDLAQATSDAAERTLLVAAFIASGYSATLSRESKPFNPLLGETFEWQSADSSCRFVCEQVSHHPPISCWWSDSTAGWQYWGEIELRSKFWGKSVEMLPTGTCWLMLGNELWSWNKANMSINNIILGTYWLDWYGNITITNHTTGANTVLHFPKSSGRQLDHRGTVQCAVNDASGHPKYHLQGKYTDCMIRVPAGQQQSDGLPEQELFRVNPPVEQGDLQYNMTLLAMSLNTAEPELLRHLPPTDSRFRPDQRALEDGEVDRATAEKLRLEEKQRQARKERKDKGEAFFPSWFKLRSLTPQQQQGADQWLGTPLVHLPGQPAPCLWEFTGEYWEAKARSDWSRCPDIYSGGETPSSPSQH